MALLELSSAFREICLLDVDTIFKYFKPAPTSALFNFMPLFSLFCYKQLRTTESWREQVLNQYLLVNFPWIKQGWSFHCILQAHSIRVFCASLAPKSCSVHGAAAAAQPLLFLESLSLRACLEALLQCMSTFSKPSLFIFSCWISQVPLCTGPSWDEISSMWFGYFGNVCKGISIIFIKSLCVIDLSSLMTNWQVT